MITALEFIQGGLKQLHGKLDKQLDNITPEQLHAVPAGNPKANTIAWGLWHYARTEDNVVQYILQNKKTPIWVEGATRRRRACRRRRRARACRRPKRRRSASRTSGAFKEYMGKVWASTDALIAKNDPALLDRMVTIRPLGEMHAMRALGHGLPHARHDPLRRNRAGAHARGRGGRQCRLEGSKQW